MFSNREKNVKVAKRMRRDAIQLKRNGRDNVHYINGRKYISKLGEAGAKSQLQVYDASEEGDWHRCHGTLGGHSDLMAGMSSKSSIGCYHQLKT